jgi:hypothetical protein
MKSKRIAKQREMQQQRTQVRQFGAMIDVFWAIDPVVHAQSAKEVWPESALDVPLPRCRAFPDLVDPTEPVDVYFLLHYPLTEAVPEGSRESLFKAQTVKAVLLEIRRVYETIYAEDERLGGPVKHPDSPLVNRGFGPWVWGHDMSDLAVEYIQFMWVTPTHCHANVFVGS